MVSTEPPRIIDAQLNEGAVPFSEAHPVQFALDQNVPNPFNPTTTIRFTVPQDGTARLAIHNIHGQLVRVLVDGPTPAGHHEVAWDGLDSRGRQAASGVYLFQLTHSAANPQGSPTNRRAATVRRMVLVR